jgi:hypothetical protein
MLSLLLHFINATMRHEFNTQSLNERRPLTAHTICEGCLCGALAL